MVTRKFLVQGRVQGVGYRYYAQRCARDREVSGYVRNLWDGSVEVVAQGPVEALDLLAADLRQGPRSARVQGVIEEELEHAPIEGFHIEFI